MILETTFKSQPLQARTAASVDGACAATHLQMVDSTSQVMSAKTEALRVAVYDAGGVGSNGPRELDRVLRGTRSGPAWERRTFEMVC